MNRIDLDLARHAEDHHGVFTLTDALAAGLSTRQCEHRVRAGLWVPVHDGVFRVVGSELSVRGRILAACLVRADTVASHRSAAFLWDLPGARTDIVEVTSPRHKRSQQSGIVVHESERIDHEHRSVVDGISVTTAARTLLDLGAVHDSSVVEMALERALRRELVTICELSQLVRALGRRGRNGVGVLRQLVETRDPAHAPTESDMETRLRRVLRRHGLPEPVPQFVIRDDAGHFVARVDFAYPEQRIAIEYDSFEHHTGTVAHVRDHSRRNRIEGLHWAVIVATVADIRSGGDQLAQTLRNRLAPPSLPFGVEKPRWSA